MIAKTLPVVVLMMGAALPAAARTEKVSPAAIDAARKAGKIRIMVMLEERAPDRTSTQPSPEKRIAAIHGSVD